MHTVLDLTGSASLSWQNEQGYFVVLKEPTAFFLNYSLTPGIHSVTCPACFYKFFFFFLMAQTRGSCPLLYEKKSAHFDLTLAQLKFSGLYRDSICYSVLFDIALQDCTETTKTQL